MELPLELTHLGAIATSQNVLKIAPSPYPKHGVQKVEMRPETKFFVIGT